VIATVDGEVISDPTNPSNGMVIDFGDLKKAMMSVIDAPYDHAFMIWKEDPRAALLQQAHDMWHNDENKFHLTDFVPTAENITKHWFGLLEAELRLKYGIRLQSIEMYETPSSSAIYTREDFLGEI
jgi:6-pyruvoyltetrahydropterin/6-carboxytetrahydropterin synthase